MVAVLTSCEKETLYPSNGGLYIALTHIPKWEGTQIVNDPYDQGGLTNSGLTYTTWEHLHQRLKLNNFEALTANDVSKCIKWYYTTHNCHKLNNIKLQALFTEFYWGGYTFIKEVLPEDFRSDKLHGYALNEKAIAYFNSMYIDDQETYIRKTIEFRRQWLYKKCENNPTQKKFLQGWLNRINDLEEKLNNINYYTVRSGDTLWSLSKQLGTDILTLRMLNSTESTIYKSQIIYY